MILAVIPGTQAFAAACAAGVAALIALAEVMEAENDEDRAAALQRLGYSTRQFATQYAAGRAAQTAEEKRVARDSEAAWRGRKQAAEEARRASSTRTSQRRR